MNSPAMIDRVTNTPAAMDKIIRIAQAYWFPIRLWYCLASFIGFVSIFHFISLFYRLQKTSPTALDPSRSTIRYRRLPVGALSVFRAVAFRWTLSIGDSYTLSVAEILLTTADVVLVFSWSLIHSDSLVGLKYDPHYWANTAGHVVATQIPLVIGLGMKNNLISFLTGISFNKLKFLHRMITRVLAVLIWVHASGRMMLTMAEDTAWSQPFIRCGVLAGTSLSVLSLISIRPIRDRTYEIFVTIHLTLAFIFSQRIFIREEPNHRLTNFYCVLSKSFFIWPSPLIWGLDRVLRALRIIFFNFGYFRLKSSTELDARVKVISPYFIRITLQRPRFFHWSPGQCAYLTIPGISPFQAHPFTISSIDVPRTAFELPSNPSNTEKDGRGMYDSTSPAQGLKELAFFCRVRKGFTEHFRNAAGGEQPWKVLLDGPYSTPPVLRGYATALLIAGGSGVTFTLPLLLDIVHHAKSGKQTCNRVIFVWAIRDIGLAGWISDVLVPVLQNLPTSLALEIQLYITSATGQVKAWDEDSAEGDTEAKTSSEGGKDLAPTLFRLPSVRVRQGRPDLRAVVDEEIECASGDISVNVCGPHTLANGVRSTLGAPRFVDILKGGPSVTLHVETFGL